ncbi:HAD-IA family hydrolase [Gordonia pseudamarae]|jgi:HAD superfamily hydrolase (TIGR01509 family)|uniref:HAD-IA family hydrolase n=1 Tax=Gordonia pseudamarae TaxID=2831662 RepID=A0ABX6IHI9_9ACTN|nr:MULTISPECIES: HAD family phosphatase [Gordonia]MBD0021391.1 HAD family phosphatase [Gordonia sp. (in: high G+C Gram-positive bacteria)]QHN26438.1 HAD-IA family hydrolase [Gordonia pseudamarae]QHN35333.1 HAD-IA family hydrolase [Gordonia pseudamarae]
MSTAPVAPAAVLWDMDGTLLDSEPIWDIAVEKFTLRHGITMSAALRESTLGNSLPDAITKVHDAADVAPGDRDLAGDSRWIIDQVAILFGDGLPWRPGAEQVLDLLVHRGIPSVLVTNTIRELTDIALDTLGRHRFAATVCSDEVVAGKPQPYLYVRAAELVGQHPGACLAVEDSPTGTLAATTAGCPTLVVPSAVPVPKGSLRSFRTSLAGISFDDLVAAWTGEHGHIH